MFRWLQVAQCFEKVIEGDERWAVINAAQPIEAISAQVGSVVNVHSAIAQHSCTTCMVNAPIQVSSSMAGSKYEHKLNFKGIPT